MVTTPNENDEQCAGCSVRRSKRYEEGRCSGGCFRINDANARIAELEADVRTLTRHREERNARIAELTRERNDARGEAERWRYAQQTEAEARAERAEQERDALLRKAAGIGRVTELSVDPDRFQVPDRKWGMTRAHLWHESAMTVRLTLACNERFKRALFVWLDAQGALPGFRGG